jgi:hypothetical protein
MKDLYNGEMKYYNHQINKHIHKDVLICSVCSEGKREAMVMPCGHAHFCKICAKKSMMEGQCKIC